MLIRLDAIGDYVLFRNYIEILKKGEHYKNYKITFLVNSAWKSLSEELDCEHKEAVKWGEFVLGDLNNIEQLRLVFSKYKIDAVMHFAAFAYVGESVKNPEKYYVNNVSNTLNILKVMKEFNCNYFIFSSTCATYGNPEY